MEVSSTSRMRECIADEKRAREIRDAIAEGHISYGMQTFDQSLMQLYKSNWLLMNCWCRHEPTTLASFYEVSAVLQRELGDQREKEVK